MPQTIDQGKSAKTWKEALGEDWKVVQEQWLHTLGNLTLTAYNPDLGNRPYSEKQDIFDNSHLELNKYFEDVSKWTATEIRKRGELLSAKVAGLWTRPPGTDYRPSVDQATESLSRSERRQRCLDYWTALLAHVKQRGKLRRFPKASWRGWIGFPIGKSGFRILTFVNFAKRTIGVALSCMGPNGLQHFTELRSHRDEIEAALGVSLLWQELVFGTASHITLRLSDANPALVQDWPRQHEWLATTLESFHSVFSKRCKLLDNSASPTGSGPSRREHFWRGLLERAAPNNVAFRDYAWKPRLDCDGCWEKRPELRIRR